MNAVQVGVIYPHSIEEISWLRLQQFLRFEQGRNPDDVDNVLWATQEACAGSKLYSLNYDLQMVGFATLAPTGYMAFLYVTPWHRSRGLGERFLREYDVRHLLVHPDNKRAIAFYERHGFQTTQVHIGVNRLKMERNTHLTA